MMSKDGTEREPAVGLEPSLPLKSPFDGAGEVSKESKSVEKPNTEGISTGDGDQPSTSKPPQPGPQYKRGRGRTFFKELPRRGLACQVPGCDRSLFKLRDYYKRYKICPYHLELNCIVVEGQSIRFCQQCGRFQLLEDFDGDRRSCRRKLSKHNERRRRAESLAETANHEGISLETHPSPDGSPIKDSSQLARPSHGRSMRAAAVMGNARVASIVKSLSSDTEYLQALNPTFAKGLKLPPSETDREPTPPPSRPSFRREAEREREEPFGYYVIKPLAVRVDEKDAKDKQKGPTSNFNIFSGGEQHRSVIPAATIQSNLNPQRQSMSRYYAESGRNSAFRPYGSQGEGKGVGKGMANENLPQGLYNNNNNRLNTFQSTSSSQTHAMRGMMPSLGSTTGPGPGPGPGPGGGADAELIKLLSTLIAAQKAQQEAGPSSYSSFRSAPEKNAIQSFLEGIGSSVGLHKPTFRATPIQSSSMNTGVGDPALVSLSLKLYNTTPDQLPQSMYEQLRLLGTKSSTYTEISSRPGCVHITISYLANEVEREWTVGDIRTMVNRLLSRSEVVNSFPKKAPVLLQIHSEDSAKAAIIYDGELTMILNLASPCKSPYVPGPIPTHLRILPLAIVKSKAKKPPPVPSFFNKLCRAAGYSVAGTEEGQYEDHRGSTFILVASNISATDCFTHQDLVLCRQGGRNVMLEIQSVGPIKGCLEDDCSAGWVHMRVPASEITTTGVYTVEVQRKPFVSAPAAFAVVESEAIAAELRQLEAMLDILSPTPNEFTCLCTMVVQNVGLVSAWHSSLGTEPGEPCSIEEMRAQGCEWRVFEVSVHVAAMSLRLYWPHVLDMALRVAAATANENAAGVLLRHVMEEYERVGHVDKWRLFFARLRTEDGEEDPSIGVRSVLASWAATEGNVNNNLDVNDEGHTQEDWSAEDAVETDDGEEEKYTQIGQYVAHQASVRQYSNVTSTPSNVQLSVRCVVKAMGLAVLVPLLFPQPPLLLLFMLLPMGLTAASMDCNPFMSKRTIVCCTVCSMVGVVITSRLERVQCCARNLLQSVPMLRAVSIGAWSCAVSERLHLQSWARFVILLSNSVAATVSELEYHVTAPQIIIGWRAQWSLSIVLGVLISCMMLSTFFPLFLISILTHRKLLNCGNLQSSKTMPEVDVDE